MEFGGWDWAFFPYWRLDTTYPIVIVSASVASNPAAIKVTTNVEFAATNIEPTNNDIERAATDFVAEADPDRLQDGAKLPTS